MKYKCLSIGGFDGSGGAGIQADLKTFSATGSYGMTVLTALPVQNTIRVKSCYDVSLQCIKEQMEVIFEDIVPDAIKIGMLFSSEIIEVVADFLSQKALGIPIVLDPVMVAKSGAFLLKSSAVETLKEKLIPMASILTPNLPEAQALIPGVHSKEVLAEKLFDLGCQSVLLKGGHENSFNSEDLFFSIQAKKILSEKRIASQNTHGTGCTLSAAITSFLAQGESHLRACEKAKIYLSEALLAASEMSIGKGHGPVHHFYHFWN